MLVDAESWFEGREDSEVDLCILGGGVAGITLAHALKDTGLRIVLLEAGGEGYDPAIQSFYATDKRPTGFPDPLHSRLRMLGGSSNHWQNSVERLSPIDLIKRSWIPHSGWPIDFEALAAWYPKAEAYCGAGAEGYDFDYWGRLAETKDAFMESPNFLSVVSKNPLIPTRFFERFGEALTVSSNVTVVTHAAVSGIDFDAVNERVTGVLCSTLSERNARVKAKRYAMCFGGIENSRMLLAFNQRNENRLGNRHDAVGRYFMEHPTIRAAHLLPIQFEPLGPLYDGVVIGEHHVHARAYLREESQFRHQLTNLRTYFTPRSRIELSTGIGSAHILRDGFEKRDLPDGFGTHVMRVIQDFDVVAGAFLKKRDFSPSILDYTRDFGGYELVSMIEQTPHPENRVLLSSVRDQHGVPQASIAYHISQEDKEAAWGTLSLLAQDPATAKLGRLRLLNLQKSRVWSSQLGYGQHHIGGTRMASSDCEGVVDSDLRVFGAANLFISGSSVFPTGGHVPPTLTIVALTLRLAAYLEENRV